MDHVIYISVLFESIIDYRKVMFVTFLIKNDENSLLECGF